MSKHSNYRFGDFDMSLLQWKPEYSVGIQSMDDEHREMIDLINATYEKLDSDADADQVEEQLGEILSTISMHFALEERWMEQHNYTDYEARITATPPNLDISEAAGGAHDRRSMPVIVADCTNAGGGQQDLPVLSIGCFFLLQQSTQSGQESEIFGEFATECSTPGFAGPDPTIVPGPKIIQLYKDSDGNDA